MSGTLDLIRQCARAHPTLLIVEDVHWLDRDSVELLAMLEANLRGMPVAMVVTCRPEALPLATERLEPTIISLPPTSSDDALRILEARLGDDTLLSSVKDHLVSRAQGIPLFLEELARSLIEDGTPPQQSGRFHLPARAGHRPSGDDPGNPCERIDGSPAAARRSCSSHPPWDGKCR